MFSHCGHIVLNTIFYVCVLILLRCLIRLVVCAQTDVLRAEVVALRAAMEANAKQTVSMVCPGLVLLIWI